MSTVFLGNAVKLATVDHLNLAHLHSGTWHLLCRAPAFCESHLLGTEVRIQVATATLRFRSECHLCSAGEVWSRFGLVHVRLSLGFANVELSLTVLIVYEIYCQNATKMNASNISDLSVCP